MKVKTLQTSYEIQCWPIYWNIGFLNNQILALVLVLVITGCFVYTK